MGTHLKLAEAGYTYSPTQDIHIITCAACSIPFGITTAFENRRREDHGTFYCPVGHSNFYPQDNEVEKLRKQLVREKDWRQWEADQRMAAEADAKHQRYVAGAAKGRITKMKKRIAAGVCPAPGCKRSGLGEDVAAHIKSCHPGFSIDE